MFLLFEKILSVSPDKFNETTHSKSLLLDNFSEIKIYVKRSFILIIYISKICFFIKFQNDMLSIEKIFSIFDSFPISFKNSFLNLIIFLKIVLLFSFVKN